MGSHNEAFGVSAPENSVTPAVPMTRREARALWEAEQKGAVQMPAAVTPEPSTANVEDVSPRSLPKPQTKVHKPSKPLKPIKRKQARKAQKLQEVEQAASVAQVPRRRTGRMATLVAMSFVAGLAVATTVPANALLTADEIRSLSLGVSTGFEPGQEVEAANGTTVTARDKVSATRYDGRTGFITGVTYVNNPNGKIQWPVRVTVPISDLFGTRADPFGGSGTTFHHGMDFNPGEGFPIQSIADGVVTGVFAEDNSSLGWHVIVQHEIDGRKVWSVYAHLLANSVQVKVGQKLQVTDIIGQCGNSGYSTGTHLHFEIRVDTETGWVDPLEWLRKYAK